jgi:hypothetical protein
MDDNDESENDSIDLATAELIDSKLTSLHEWENVNNAIGVGVGGVSDSDHENELIVNNLTNLSFSHAYNSSSSNHTSPQKKQQYNSSDTFTSNDNGKINEIENTNRKPSPAIEFNISTDSFISQLLTSSFGDLQAALEFDDLLSILKSDSLSNYFCQCPSPAYETEQTAADSKLTSPSTSTSTASSLATLHPGLQSFLLRLPTCRNCSNSILSTSELFDNLDDLPIPSSTSSNPLLLPRSLPTSELTSKVFELERKVKVMEDLWRYEREVSTERYETISRLEHRLKSCEETNNLLQQQFLSLLAFIPTVTDLRKELKSHEELLHNIDKQQQTITTTITEKLDSNEMKKLIHTEVDSLRKKEMEWKKAIDHKFTTLETDRFYPTRSRILEMLSTDSEPIATSSPSTAEAVSTTNTSTISATSSNNTKQTPRRHARKPRR